MVQRPEVLKKWKGGNVPRPEKEKGKTLEDNMGILTGK